MRTRSILFALLILAVAAGGYWYLRPASDGTAPAGVTQAAPAVPVETARVTAEDLVLSIPAVGTLRSNESVMVSPEIAGRIVELHADEGAAVSEGDPISTLDQSIYRAQIAEVQARISLSESNYERARELLARQAGTQRALDEAEAQLKADRADLLVAQALLDKTVIRAPFEGVLGLWRVSIGQYIEAGDVIVNIESIDPLKVDFRVPEIYFNRTSVGQAITVIVDAVGNEPVLGNVYAIDPLVDENGRSLVLRANIPNDDRRLRPGLFARIELIYDRRANALMVPEEALVPIGRNSYVYVVENDRARLVQIEVGQRLRGRVEVTAGLAAGDAVVTAGQLRLYDGAEVVNVGGNGGDGG
jgi:membrane fusion protein (multidrug efflux system)